MIAEKTDNFLAVSPDSPRSVQAIGIFRNAVGVAEKSDVERAAENTFIGAEPFEIHVRPRWPAPDRRRSLPKARSRRASRRKLIRDSTRARCSCSRASSGWRNARRGSGVPELATRAISESQMQRKNGVIERSGADFDLAALRRFAIGGEDHAQQFELFSLSAVLSFSEKSFPFVESLLTTGSFAARYSSIHANWRKSCRSRQSRGVEWLAPVRRRPSATIRVIPRSAATDIK